MAATSKQQVLRLYREMLRDASKFESYNFRKYAERRVREDFHKQRELAPGSAEQLRALAFGREQAAVLSRQAAISRLFPPETKSVMETLG